MKDCCLYCSFYLVDCGLCVWDPADGVEVDCPLLDQAIKEESSHED